MWDWDKYFYIAEYALPLLLIFAYCIFSVHKFYLSPNYIDLINKNVDRKILNKCFKFRQRFFLLMVNTVNLIVFILLFAFLLTNMVLSMIYCANWIRNTSILFGFVFLIVIMFLVFWILNYINWKKQEMNLKDIKLERVDEYIEKYNNKKVNKLILLLKSDDANYYSNYKKNYLVSSLLLLILKLNEKENNKVAKNEFLTHTNEWFIF